MKRIATVATAAAATVALVVGVRVVADAQDDPAPPSSEANLLSEEAITADWCGFVRSLIGADGFQPSIEVAVSAMVAGDATPSDLAAGLNVMETAPDPDAARAAGFLSSLEGEPAAIVADYSLVRYAGRQAIYAEPIANPEHVVEAARSIDDFVASTCESGA